MAEYPFIYNYESGNFLPGETRGPRYYRPSLESPKNQRQIWSAQDQEPFNRDEGGTNNLLLFGAGIGGIAAAGSIPIGNKKLWDYYLKGIRAVEEYSPGQIFRTFQLSNFLSQFETPVTQGFTISADLLQSNRVQREYLSHLIGTPDASSRLTREGLRLEGGKLFYGTGTDIALKHASAIRTPVDIGARTWLGSSWAKVVGLSEDTQTRFAEYLSKSQPLGTSAVRNPVIEGMAAQIVGGQSRAQFASRWGQAWGGELVSRFNRLLIETERNTGLPLSVKSGTATSTLGRLSLKYGLALPALYLGYQTLDWATRESSLLDDTVFEEGTTVGLATAWAKANKAISSIAETSGGHAYREAQEAIAPGSTDIQKLIAFPLIGALTATGGLYLAKSSKAVARNVFTDMSAASAVHAAEESMAQYAGSSSIARAAKHLATKEGLYSQSGLMGNIWRRIATPIKDESILRFKLFGKMSPTKLAMAAGLTAGLALVAPFVPGALVPSKRPDELDAIYSGEQEIAVRKGRWWEFGRSAYEGERVSYFRPHWYPRLRMRAQEKAIWGEDASAMSPLERWFRSEFTYDLERRHYEDRPYPVTSLPFEDVPLIGPILANTIGRAIKPPRLMHTEEWLSDKGVLVQPSRGRDRIATEIGEHLPGIPTSPFTPEGAIGEQYYRLTEMTGLPGFALEQTKAALTGSESISDQIMRLESARRMFGFERKYWDLELGGLAGTTEPFRRLYPHRRRQIPLYNPIRNKMPDWLPGPGELAPDLLHGDPWVKVEEGELRLPGPGYEARYPELKGVDPSNYPLYHRFKILADVAPYSDQFKETRRQMQIASAAGYLSPEETRGYSIIQEQLSQRKQRTKFQEYQYLSPMGDIFGGEKEYYTGSESSELLAKLNRQKADQEPDQGIFAKFFGGYWEALSHNSEIALDQLTPVSPGAKLVHERTAIEHYERTKFYGTQNAFWQHPIRDFIRPTTWLAANALGYKGVPTHIEHKRNLENYFDILQYVKSSRLANMARIEGDKEAAQIFESQKDQTLFGINPFTQNYGNLLKALPRPERDYFSAFSEAETTEERKRILEIVPQNERALYTARWKLTLAEDIKRAEKMGILSEKELKEADAVINNIYAESRVEGMPTSEELIQQYWKERAPGESYADWYRRRYLLSELPALPGPDWVGWHPSVDLDDIKLKVVEHLGEDMHDYDLWASRKQAAINKPWLNQAAIDPIVNPERMSRSSMYDRINQLLLHNRMRGGVFYNRNSVTGSRDSISVDIQQEPDYKAMTRMLNQ